MDTRNQKSLNHYVIYTHFILFYLSLTADLVGSFTKPFPRALISLEQATSAR